MSYYLTHCKPAHQEAQLPKEGGDHASEEALEALRLLAKRPVGERYIAPEYQPGQMVTLMPTAASPEPLHGTVVANIDTGAQWTPGHYALDGSGGRRTKDPHLRRCGYAICSIAPSDGVDVGSGKGSSERFARVVPELEQRPALLDQEQDGHFYITTRIKQIMTDR